MIHLFSYDFWLVFHLLLLGAILLDLTVSKCATRPYIPWLLSGAWLVAAILFGGSLFITHGSEVGQIFMNGYLIEKSLSIDNVFVFYLVFHKLKIPHQYQHRILFLGVLGALVFRAFFILMGVALVKKFMWLIPLMGVFLIYMATRFWHKNESQETDNVLAFIKQWLRVHPKIKGPQLTLKEGKKRFLTVSGLALIYIELSDIIFAFDSVPAIMAFTLEVELIYLCNVFAILGLRSLYFVIAEMSQRFKTVHYGVSLLLGFAGIKMLLSPVYHFPKTLASLAIVSVVVGCSLIEIRNLRKKA